VQNKDFLLHLQDGSFILFLKKLPNQTKCNDLWRFPRIQQLSITILLEPELLSREVTKITTSLLPCFTRILFVELYLIISASLDIQKKIFYFFMISDQYASFFCVHPYLLQFFKTSSTNTCYMYVCHGLFCLFILWSSVRLHVIQ
jgi:hypothetical protein